MYVVLILYSIAKVGIFLNKSKVNVGNGDFCYLAPRFGGVKKC